MSEVPAANGGLTFGVEVPSLTCRLLPVLVLALIAAERIHRWHLSRKQQESGPAGAIRVWILQVVEFVTALALFCLSGPGLILLNKHIYTELAFSFPMAVSSLGSLLLVVIARGGVMLGFFSLGKPTLPWQLFLSNVLPLSVCSSLSIVVGNIVYVYISVPLIQILKSGTLVLVMIFGFVVGVERFRWALVFAVITMVAGISVALQSSYDISESEASTNFFIGIALMMLGNVLEAMRAVFLQVSVGKLEFFDSLYWSSPAMALVGFSMSFPIELQQMIQVQFSRRLVCALCGSAALGALVSFATFWITKLIGGLSVKVLQNARNIGLVLYSVVALGEKCTDMEYIGYSIALIGIAMYDRARATPVAASTVATVEEALPSRKIAVLLQSDHEV